MFDDEDVRRANVQSIVAPVFDGDAARPARVWRHDDVVVDRCVGVLVAAGAMR